MAQSWTCDECGSVSTDRMRMARVVLIHKDQEGADVCTALCAVQYLQSAWGRTVLTGTTDPANPVVRTRPVYVHEILDRLEE